MYTIYADGQLIYAPNLIEDGYSVLSPKLTAELNKAGSLEFALPPTNPMYDGIQKMKSVLTAHQDGKEIFRSRCLNHEKDFYRRKKIYCEGDLAFLLDSVQRPYSFQGDVPELFRQFISNHNEQVDAFKRFVAGEITVTDANGYINREDKTYPNTLDEINSALIDTHGGYIRTRLDTDGVRYVDLLADYNSVSSQVIEFGVNLLDITEYIKADDVFTVLIPLGAEVDGARLTIKSVNDGKDYIQNDAAISLFGRICKVETWDDVTEAKNLLSKGKAFLDAGIEMAVSLSIKAVDLHLIDVDTEQIRLGDRVRVISKPHGLDSYFLCSKIVLDLVSPDQSEYTFGASFKTLTEHQIRSTRQSSLAVAYAQAAQAAVVSQGSTKVTDDGAGNVVLKSIASSLIVTDDGSGNVELSND